MQKRSHQGVRSPVSDDKNEPAEKPPKFGVICDIDGVLHRGDRCLPGAVAFVRRLTRSGRPYLFVTNSPEESARQLHFSLKRYGFDIAESYFYTSAEATATFIAGQKKTRSCLRDRHPRSARGS